MSSYAKHYGIDLKKLKTESPFHPEQIRNRWLHEIKADIYWQERKNEEDAAAIWEGAKSKAKYAFEYFPQIPGK